MFVCEMISTPEDRPLLGDRPGCYRAGMMGVADAQPLRSEARAVDPATLDPPPADHCVQSFAEDELVTGAPEQRVAADLDKEWRELDSEVACGEGHGALLQGGIARRHLVPRMPFSQDLTIWTRGLMTISNRSGADPSRTRIALRHVSDRPSFIIFFIGIFPVLMSWHMPGSPGIGSAVVTGN
jgi:hypothetical protein